MFWYDHIVTLDREINLFWNKKITGATVLFFVNRYSTVFYMTYVFPVWPLSMKYEVSISSDGYNPLIHSPSHTDVGRMVNRSCHLIIIQWSRCVVEYYISAIADYLQYIPWGG